MQTATNNFVSVQEVLDRLQQVKPCTIKQTGQSQWKARCPAPDHEDKNPSLDVSVGNDGTILFDCKSRRCSFGAICEGLGFSPSAMFGNNTKKFSSIISVYDYRGEDGQLLFQVCRTENKEFPARKPDGSWGIKGIKRIPYHLPELLTVDNKQIIFIPEGEKDCDSLAKLGLIATCNPGGAGKWRAEYNQYLKGRWVVVLSDNDTPGREHAEQVAKSLVGIAKEVRIVQLDNLPDGGDITDWLATGGTLEGLRLRVKEAKPFVPADSIEEPANTEAKPEAESSYQLDDIGNGQRFAVQHSDKMRYCQTTKKWLYYDQIKWNPEKGRGQAEALGKKTARSIVNEARNVTHAQEGKIFTWAHQSGTAYKIEAMLKMASSEDALVVYRNDFDKDSMLFNVLNKTWALQLEVMRAREHNPVDLISKVAAVSYDPEAKCLLWLKCLDTWMDGDNDKIDYLQRLAGWCLTGDVSPRVFPIFYGPGLNGKTVFCDTLVQLMGDYATVAPKDFLKVKKYEEHPTEIANLYGKRLVVAQETKPGMRLRIDLVKMMTGERQVTGRFMRQDNFTFNLTHKTILMTNNLPIIDDTSDSIWDRVHLLEWNVRIPDDQVDIHLTERLKREWPGILNWMLVGCRHWQEDAYKLLQPEAVKKATKTYRTESDPLSEFVAECCILDNENLLTPVKILRASYNKWAEENQVKFPIGSRRFNAYFRERGKQVEQKWLEAKNQKCWCGIGLQNELF